MKTDYFLHFQELASNSSSDPEKVGRFSSQAEAEGYIFPNILSKLPSLSCEGSLVIDIGSGCSRPVRDLISHTENNQQKLVLVDSYEQLKYLPKAAHVQPFYSRFPDEKVCDTFKGKADCVIVYSVFHYVFLDSNFTKFLDEAVSLLNYGGQLILGDIPNASKKKRFLSSESGKQFHRQWSQSDELPEIVWNNFEPMTLDDDVIAFLMQRYRNMGFETYLYPQHPMMPFSQTREDLVITRGNV